MHTNHDTAAMSEQSENSLPGRMNIAGGTSIKLGNSEVLYLESLLPDADKWFLRLRDEVPWSPETVKMYGRPLVLRRETCNYGDDYDYNVNAKPAIEWAGPVLDLKKILEELTGRVFTQCACNLYPDGETGIGLHHDKRHPLLVASISFGAVRIMGFAPKGGKLDKSLPMIPLASGSLVLFTDAINENFKHTIVEDRSVQEPRISVTFREFAADKPKASKQKTSVALQHKSQTDCLDLAPAGMFPAVDYSTHTDDQLHQATVAAAATYKKKRSDADNYAYDVFIPALNQIILRYKQQGRATPYRLNNCPTVDAYFKSIGLNYTTVRSWKSRAQQRLLQAAADAGTKPAPNRGRDPVPHLNNAARRALIEASHKAVEIMAAVEAGRDVKNEIAEFKAIMNAKRLDDILEAHEQEPDYKGILAKILRFAKSMKPALPAQFVEKLAELTEPAKLRVAAAAASAKTIGKTKPASHAEKKPARKAVKAAQAVSDPQALRLTQPTLMPGKKYTVREAASGGYGIFEAGSRVILQKHSTWDAAWGAIEAQESSVTQDESLH